MHIQVCSKRFQCGFQLQEKLTVIIGDSGNGKTVLAKALVDDSGAYEVTLSDNAYQIFRLTKRNYDAVLSYHMESPCIFIVDDEDFIYSKSFVRHLAENNDHYYIFICRLDSDAITGNILNDGEYVSKGVYMLLANGVEHWLEEIVSSRYLLKTVD